MVARSEQHPVGVNPDFFRGPHPAWVQKLRNMIPVLRQRDVPPLMYTPPPQSQEPQMLREELIHKWYAAPRRIVSYDPGVLPDGTPYKGGRILYIGDPNLGEEQQVMDDSLEVGWVQQTVETMWKGSHGRQIVANRGFGLGGIDIEIHKRMQKSGGKHVIIELNKQVYEDAKEQILQWLAEAEYEGRALRIVAWGFDGEVDMCAETIHDNKENMIDIVLINGDADRAILKFEPRYFDKIFSDTHQLQESELGLHDILQPGDVADRVKDNGRFAFLAWHRNNQTDGMEQEQRARVERYYEVVTTVSRARAIVHPGCDYLEQGKVIILPSVVCQYPRRS